MEAVRDLYRERFNAKELESKNRLWKILAAFFQRYIEPGGTVLDLGAGQCEFINHIRAGRKLAVDLNPDTATFAAPGVEFHQCHCADLDFLAEGAVDAVFMSNFLEHLADKAEVLRVLKECLRVLRPGGRMLVLMPNIRLAYREYWDFFDHHVALSDKSMVEGAKLAGFRPLEVIPAFLPYTTKSRLPQWGILVRMYLRLPILWKLFGKQALVVAEKPRR